MRRIVVKNFGPLKDIDLLIPDFLVLIGEQAAGKSTLVKLIYFFEDIGRFFLYSKTYNEFVTFQEVKDSFINNVNSNFNLYKVDLSGNKLFEISYYYDKEESMYISLSNKALNSDGQSLDVNLSSGIIDKLKAIAEYILMHQKRINGEGDRSYKAALEKVLFDKLFDIINFKLPLKPEINFFIESRSELIRNTALDLFEENGKNSSLHQLFQLKTIRLIRHLDEHRSRHIKQVFSEIYQKIIKAQYVLNDNIRFLETKDKTKIPLSAGSSGQREALYILVYLDYILNEGIRPLSIIEEPEAHLFPTSQVALIETIEDAHHTLEGSGTILTTHSPYVLGSLMLILQKRKEILNNLSSDKKSLRYGAFLIKDGVLVDLIDWDNLSVNMDELDTASEILGNKIDSYLYDEA